MAEIGNGYGSECHLLRYLGRHRKSLNDAVLKALGCNGSIEWLDFLFDERKVWKDAEWKGLDFLIEFGEAWWCVPKQRRGGCQAMMRNWVGRIHEVHLLLQGAS